jgi:hypothetical protein
MAVPECEVLQNDQCVVKEKRGLAVVTGATLRLVVDFAVEFPSITEAEIRKFSMIFSLGSSDKADRHESYPRQSG